jgi:hypothetical protein
LLIPTWVQSSPIVGPFFGQTPGFLLFSVSDRIYGILFSLSAHANFYPSDLRYPSHKNPSCQSSTSPILPRLAGGFFSPPLLDHTRRVAPLAPQAQLGDHPSLLSFLYPLIPAYAKAMLRAIKTLEFRAPGDTALPGRAEPCVSPTGNENASEILSGAPGSAYPAFSVSSPRPLSLCSSKFIL